MKNTSLGKLQQVPLHEVWEDETKDFILWLQNNLDVFEMVGLTLTKAEQNNSTGAMNLIAEDEFGQPVVIVAQLTTSSHDRLGQLMSLLATVEARFALWIVAEPKPEHIKTLHWLNESTHVEIELLKLEAVRIGHSPVAVLLKGVLDPYEEARQKTNNLAIKKWDETSFFTELEANNGIQEVEMARQIFNWARANVSYVWWGESLGKGCFVPIFHYAGTKHHLFAVHTEGTIEVYFQWYQYHPPFDTEEKRLELLKRFNEIKGVDLPKEVITQRPILSLAGLQQNHSLNQFLEIFNWFIREV